MLKVNFALIKWCVTIAILLCCYTGVQAKYSYEKINIDSLHSGRVVIHSVSYLIDKTAQKTLQEVLATPQDFVPNEKGYLNFGYFDKQVWLKFPIQSSKKEQLIIEFHPYHTDTIKVFCVQNGVAQCSVVSGIHMLKSGAANNVANGRYYFSFEADSGYTNMYLQMKSKYSSLRATIKLWKATDFEKRKISPWESEPFKYVLVGFTLFAAFIGLLLFFYNRSWVYAAYSIFVLCNIFMVFTIKGWIIPYLPWLTFFEYDLRGLTNGLVVAVSAWYFYLLVPKQYSNAWVRKIFILYAALIGFAIISAIILPDNETFFKIYFFLLKPIYILCVPISIYHFYYSARKGYKLSWLFLLSIMPIAVNSTFHLLQLLNFMSVFYPNFYWEFSIIFELLLYTFAMSYRYKIIVDENTAFNNFLEKNNVQYISNLYTIQENERIRIARDLHDSIGQKLSVIKMMLSTVAMQEQNKTSNEEIELATQLVDETIQETRNISHNLLPTELRFGLVDAIKRIADEINKAGNTTIEVAIDSQVKNIAFSKEKEIAIFRIVQEVFSNILKHAAATKVSFQIEWKAQQLHFTIKDNGRGFNVKNIGKSSGIGWQNIFARIKMMNGTISIQSENITGTIIQFTIPL